MFFFPEVVCPSQFDPPFLMLTMKTNTKVCHLLLPCFLSFSEFICASQFCASQFYPPLPHADKKRSKTCLSSIASSFLTFKDLVCPSQFYPPFLMLTIKTKTREVLSCVVVSILPFIFRLDLSKSKNKDQRHFFLLPSFLAIKDCIHVNFIDHFSC